MTERYNPRAFIGKRVKVVIDRPCGSRHPAQGYLYPINYGYVPEIAAPDGDDLDAYVTGVFAPLESFEGLCVAVIHRLDDEDDKLVLAGNKIEITDEEILTQTAFQEQWFTSVLLRN